MRQLPGHLQKRAIMLSWNSFAMKAWSDAGPLRETQYRRVINSKNGLGFLRLRKVTIFFVSALKLESTARRPKRKSYAILKSEDLGRPMPLSGGSFFAHLQDDSWKGTIVIFSGERDGKVVQVSFTVSYLYLEPAVPVRGHLNSSHDGSGS